MARFYMCHNRRAVECVERKLGERRGTKEGEKEERDGRQGKGSNKKRKDEGV